MYDVNGQPEQLHLPVKFGADIFIQCGVIDILPKLKMASAAILDLDNRTFKPERQKFQTLIT